MHIKTFFLKIAYEEIPENGSWTKARLSLQRRSLWIYQMQPAKKYDLEEQRASAGNIANPRNDGVYIQKEVYFFQQLTASIPISRSDVSKGEMG